jgi:hypothetical protein
MKLSALPEIGISQILGLVELLVGKGGREDIYKLAGELSMELGETLTVIRAAEMLGLVHTPGGDVEVEAFGHKVVDASITDRKDLIRGKPGRNRSDPRRDARQARRASAERGRRSLFWIGCELGAVLGALWL